MKLESPQSITVGRIKLFDNSSLSHHLNILCIVCFSFFYPRNRTEGTLLMRNVYLTKQPYRQSILCKSRFLIKEGKGKTESKKLTSQSTLNRWIRGRYRLLIFLFGLWNISSVYSPRISPKQLAIVDTATRTKGRPLGALFVKWVQNDMAVCRFPLFILIMNTICNLQQMSNKYQI